MDFTDRQRALLQVIIEQVITHAEPVSSKFLSRLKQFPLSAATLRNEMRVLEDAGMLAHPHTSAGRVPTEDAYRFYLHSLMPTYTLTGAEIDALLAVCQAEHESKRRQKALARYMSGKLGAAVMIVTGGSDVYYTGLTALFSQPEFRDHASTLNISSLFDQVEQKLAELYGLVSNAQQAVVIGSENPLGNMCTTAVQRIGSHDLCIILGPVRMPYNKAKAYLTQIAHYF